MTETSRTVTAEEIETWIVDRLVQQMNVNRDELRVDQPLITHGVDSLQLISLVGLLEEWLGCRFTTNPFEQYPSIAAVSQFTAQQLALGRTTIDPSAN